MAKKARPTKPSRTTAPTAPGGGRPSDAKLYGGLAALVGGLAALVMWALPGNGAPVVPDDDGGVVETVTKHPAKLRNPIERPLRATLELTVVTQRPEDAARRLATPTALAAAVGTRSCGEGCDAVTKLLEDEDGFELDVSAVDETTLPGKETWDTVAAGLTPAEREALGKARTAVTFRANAPFAKEHVAARAGLAVARVLGEGLDGFVYDEATRRIQRWQDVPVIAAPLGAPAFDPRTIVVELHRQEDGTARAVTLGMMRWGCPDLALQGANMDAGPRLALVLDAVAARLALGEDRTPIAVTLEDVARVTGRRAEDLSSSPGDARKAELDVIAPEREEGDPDNELVELVPGDGGGREAWDVIVANLFGVPRTVTSESEDRELNEVARRARGTLAAGIERFERGQGALFVKGPFVIPPDARLDGGPTTETLWVDVAACDAKLCTGVLAGDPVAPANVAAGKTTSVERGQVVDWVVRQRDGGAIGGESLKVLRSRNTGK